MSLLFYNLNDDMKSLAKLIFEKHFELDPKLNTEYDDRRKMLMYEDILYSLGFLDTSIKFSDDKIFVDFTVWIYQLMCNLMKDLSRERLKDQMVLHLTIMRTVYLEHFSEKGDSITSLIDIAIKAVKEQSDSFEDNKKIETGKFIDIKKDYLECLLKNDTKGAVELIGNIAKSGIDLIDIYINIIQEVMYEVGNLWHRNLITVDKEHYCTATTQVVLSQFYPVIFSSPRNGLKLLSCCVGSELHEMGIRMLSDLFEYNGWDSIYLGAAVPKQAILSSIRENMPELVALSVTMPQHLSLCLDIVTSIKEKYPAMKVAVGGRAFKSTTRLWDKWNIDVYTENADQLIEWANQNIVKAKEVF
ncbi:MAG: cobalamin-dependent protein [Clostridia bacterium]|nr:cobalamin-dependent protein [Clostridia bacterium]